MMLSKTDSTLLKGIAIVFVFCHNFLHWIEPLLGENEFFYREEPANNFTPQQPTKFFKLDNSLLLSGVAPK